eukprot:3052609-Lingulodinium_polyedra.AAC.1
MGLRKVVEVTSHTEITNENLNPEHEETGEEAWDDVTGALFDPREVRRARLKELEYVKEKACGRRCLVPKPSRRA